MHSPLTSACEPGGLDTPLFPEDYTSSRRRFFERLQPLEARFDSFPTVATGSRGPNDKLHVDFATFGDVAAPHHLLVIAGTHGVEAPVGAAIQLAFANELRAVPPALGITFVHCLNPWGMSNGRRTNANNVDLNRNCVFEPFKREGGPDGYELSRSLTMPDQPTGFGLFALKALGKVARHGYSTMVQSITGGQFEDPDGLYYGGSELQDELTLLEGWIRSNLRAKEHITVIDIHSGLGNFGSRSILLDYARESEQYRRAVAVFGSDIVQAPDSPESLTYETRGALSNLISATLPNALIDQFVLEFGTLHPFKVLHALVQESSHYRAHPDDRASPAVRALRQAFCPTAPAWRRSVVEKGLQTIKDAAKFFALK